jgi:NAD(P)-dependent dehydrogenase (short-subunit alcohol dehydrogenase family)
MAGRLNKKVAVVSGAGSSGPGWGNGKAIAVLFAREGARVFAIDCNVEAVEETRALIRAEAGECQSHRADVTVSAQVGEAVAECLRTFGRIDILVNNVGIVEVGGPLDISEENWGRVIAVNLNSVFLTCKHVLPRMLQQQAGVIVNISSIAAMRFLGYPSASYNASKGAINQLTQNIAVQYADQGIRANCVLPGMMNTPMIVEPLRRFYAAGDIEEMIRIRDAQVPMKRMGTAWDTAYAALFLASDEARYITGAQLVVDGGVSCKYA